MARSWTGVSCGQRTRFASGVETVDRRAAVGAAVTGLALGGFGALRLGDDGEPCGVGRGLVMVVEQNRFELLAHVPLANSPACIRTRGTVGAAIKIGRTSRSTVLRLRKARSAVESCL
jgi:hypothetical protein